MQSLVVRVLLLASLAYSARIVEIQTKTRNEPDADLNIGDISITIIGADFIACYVPVLDCEGDTYLKGAVDVFHTDQIGDCYNFELPEDGVGVVQLEHSGADGWLCEWVRIVLDNGTYLTCPDGEFLDDTAVHSLYCE